MKLKPRFVGEHYRPANKLLGKVALITGGDSGIGRSISVLFAREGADIAINFLPVEQLDAEQTKQYVEGAGRKCNLLPGDLTDGGFCKTLVQSVKCDFGKLHILISNVAYQTLHPAIDKITDAAWSETFRKNIDALFFLTRAAVPHMAAGSSIIVTSSETGLFGHEKLLDYASTKGAINAFIKSLAQNLVDKGIRVNAVAPGPVWTPLNPADKGEPVKEIVKFGSSTPMGRPAQPEEIAPAFVFPASNADSSYITGHVLAVLGGEIATG